MLFPYLGYTFGFPKWVANSLSFVALFGSALIYAAVLNCLCTDAQVDNSKSNNCVKFSMGKSV